MVDMAMLFEGFDWDQGNRAKCQKHGVSLVEIERLFDRPLRIEPDPAHSAREERFKAIGTTSTGRHVFLVFTLRRHGAETLIRPISARFMHRKEVQHYEEQAAKTARPED